MVRRDHRYELAEAQDNLRYWLEQEGRNTRAREQIQNEIKAWQARAKRLAAKVTP